MHKNNHTFLDRILVCDKKQISCDNRRRPGRFEHHGDHTVICSQSLSIAVSHVEAKRCRRKSPGNKLMQCNVNYFFTIMLCVRRITNHVEVKRVMSWSSAYFSSTIIIAASSVPATSGEKKTFKSDVSNKKAFIDFSISRSSETCRPKYVDCDHFCVN